MKKFFLILTVILLFVSCGNRNNPTYPEKETHKNFGLAFSNASKYDVSFYIEGVFILSLEPYSYDARWASEIELANNINITKDDVVLAAELYSRTNPSIYSEITLAQRVDFSKSENYNIQVNGKNELVIKKSNN